MFSNFGVPTLFLFTLNWKKQRKVKMTAAMNKLGKV